MAYSSTYSQFLRARAMGPGLVIGFTNSYDLKFFNNAITA